MGGTIGASAAVILCRRIRLGWPFLVPYLASAIVAVAIFFPLRDITVDILPLTY